MAGDNAAFNSTVFRTAIRATMLMGLPESTALRPTFQWQNEPTYETEDSSGFPLTWSATPTTNVTHAPVQVECAVEFANESTTEGSSAGVWDTSWATLTLLDEEYAQVVGADTVLLGGNEYEIRSVKPLGLFDVTVYQMHVQARDES